MSLLYLVMLGHGLTTAGSGEVIRARAGSLIAGLGSRAYVSYASTTTRKLVIGDRVRNIRRRKCDERTKTSRPREVERSADIEIVR